MCAVGQIRNIQSVHIFVTPRNLGRHESHSLPAHQVHSRWVACLAFRSKQRTDVTQTNFRLLWIPSCPCCTSCSRQLTTSCHLASSGVPRERRTSNTNESNTDDERRDTDTRARSSKTLWIPDQETAPPRDARMRKRIPPPEHGSTQNSQRVL